MPKTIVAVKPSSSSTGASGVTRYIAESKRDQEKEHLKDKEARPLFSNERDDLSFQEADEILAQGQGWLPEKEDVIHIVVSLEPESFKDLGDSHEERIEAFRDIIRDTASEIEKEVDVYELRWVAGIHLNTDNPHVHMAISRDGIDRVSHEPKHIDHVPRTLLPHNEIGEDGKKEFKEGFIAESVNRGIDTTRQARRERTQERTVDDSRTRTQPEQAIEQDGQSKTSPEPQHTIEESSALSPTQNGSPEQSVETVDAIDLAAPEHSPAIESPAIDTAPPGFDHEAPDTIFDLSDQEPESAFHANELDASRNANVPHGDSPDRVQKDRETIGQSMVARGEVERLDAELQSMIDHGDKRRFRVFDATHGRTRQISKFDIHRRADTRAASTVREQAIADPDKRHHARQVQYETEVDDHYKGIHDHQVIVSKTINKIGKDLDTATTGHHRLQAEVRAIQSHYRAHGLQMPVPILAREQLAKLQDQAIARHNPQRVNALENIRQALAVEAGVPTRTASEVARLEGQLLMSRAEQAARHERSYQFERNQHQTRWEIDGEKYSLAEVDRRISTQLNRSRFFGVPLKLKTINFFPSARRAAAIEAERLKDVRQIILTKIDDRKQELGTSLNQSVRMTESLTSINEREQRARDLRHGNQFVEKPEKILTRSEISHLIDHGTTLGEPGMLKQAYLLEARYQDRQSPDKRPSILEQAARAIGRAWITSMSVRTSQEKLKAFEEHRDFVPVMVKDLEGKDVTARLSDFYEPRHPIKWLANRIAETKEHRHLRKEVRQAVQTEYGQLKEELSNAQQCDNITQTIADNYRDHLHTTGQEVPEPIFTTKQIVQLEMQAIRQQDPQERFKIESLINNAELSKHVFTPQVLDAQKLPTELTGQPIQDITRDPLQTIEPPSSLIVTGQPLTNAPGREAANLPADPVGPAQDVAQDIDLIV